MYLLKHQQPITNNQKAEARSEVSKRVNPDYQQISGHIPKEIATEFKVACTKRGVSHSDGLEQAIALWLSHKPLTTNNQQLTTD